MDIINCARFHRNQFRGLDFVGVEFGLGPVIPMYTRMHSIDVLAMSYFPSTGRQIC